MKMSDDEQKGKATEKSVKIGLQDLFLCVENMSQIFPEM